MDAPIKEPKNMPKNSPWRQQRLPACQPIMTPQTVLPLFFLVAVVFIPLGIWLLVESNGIAEKIIDYTDAKGDCTWTNASDPSMMEQKTDVAADGFLQKFPGGLCNIKVEFQLDKMMSGEIVTYYGLQNYYQNHRLYVKSRNDEQLLGNLHSEGDCEPFDSAHTDKKNLPVVPCGAIANSYFNDTFKLSYTAPEGSDQEIKLIKKNIAWKTDKEVRFKNPRAPTSMIYLSWDVAFNDTQAPPNWPPPNIAHFGEGEGGGVALENEDLMVWMRTAAFPNFRKLYRRIEHTTDAGHIGLSSEGTYTLNVKYQYPVGVFGGRKQFIITETSWLGGKNPFLGICYIVVGSLSLLAGLVLVFLHICFGKATADLIDINPSSPFEG